MEQTETLGDIQAVLLDTRAENISLSQQKQLLEADFDRVSAELEQTNLAHSTLKRTVAQVVLTHLRLNIIYYLLTLNNPTARKSP